MQRVQPRSLPPFPESPAPPPIPLFLQQAWRQPDLPAGGLNLPDFSVIPGCVADLPLLQPPFAIPPTLSPVPPGFWSAVAVPFPTPSACPGGLAPGLIPHPSLLIDHPGCANPSPHFSSIQQPWSDTPPKFPIPERCQKFVSGHRDAAGQKNPPCPAGKMMH